MTKTDHLAKAKDYIAKGEGYYRKAADEIAAAIDEDGYSQREVARQVERSLYWVQRLIAWRKGDCDAVGPFSEAAGKPNRNMQGAKTIARERPEDLVAELPGPAVEKLARAATETLVERNRAKRAEHDTKPTVRDLMGDERFDPAEFWADTLIIRVNRNARELASLIKRGGGLLFGTMPPEEAFDYLHEAERLIAEARAAAQEQARDRVEV